MQTFVISDCYLETAKALDYRRLGKQRVETWQILRALGGLTKGWVNHPAVKMWRGYEYSLAVYGQVMCNEWRARGYNDNMRERFVEVCATTDDTGRPEWVYDPQFHISHKSNLIRKFPEFYGPMWPDVPNDIPYVWPTEDLRV